MPAQTIQTLGDSHCESPKASESENPHLAMNRRARGVRFARMRCQSVWCEIQATHEARLLMLTANRRF